MNQKPNHRNTGAVGALLDEYEKAIIELCNTLSGISSEHLIQIVDEDTKDADCRSIQSIIAHTVQSGYNYVVEIRKYLGEEIAHRDKIIFDTVTDFKNALLAMFEYNEKLFTDYPELRITEYDPNKKIAVRWGQIYDIEQLLEHVIVHVLRHRRQIEKFKEKLA